eukprot:COSAG04_NODE_697_length_11055_cov_5.640471_9_plen_96_part_00
MSSEWTCSIRHRGFVTRSDLLLQLCLCCLRYFEAVIAEVGAALAARQSLCSRDAPAADVAARASLVARWVARVGAELELVAGLALTLSIQRRFKC